MKKWRLVCLVLTIVWMVFIFSMSDRNASESTKLSRSVGYRVCQIFVPGYENWSEQKQDKLAEQIDYPVRKCAHAAEYAILGVLLAGTLLGGPVLKRYKTAGQYAICWGIGVLYAASDEIHQLFVPGRSGMVRDVMIDGFGVFVGLCVVYVVRCVFKKISCIQIERFC